MAVVKRIMLDKISGAVDRLTRRVVMVGIPSDSAARKPEDGSTKTPPSNAMLGYVHEYGLPEKNIPARPFLVPGVESVKDRIIAIMKKGAEAAITGDAQAVDIALTKVGLIAVEAVQNKVDTGPFAPLSPRTIARRKGPPPYRPLIDTGAMRDSIKSIIRET